MPQSFIGTGGFNSPVMPGYQPVNPALFNIGAPMAQGLQSGFGMGAELQKQQQLAAMIPLQQQEARLAIKQRQRELMQPVLIPTGDEIQSVPRGSNIDQQSFAEAKAQGMSDEQAAAASTVPVEEQLADQYRIQHFKNAVTGEEVTRPTLYKSAEQVAQEQAQAQMFALHAQNYANLGESALLRGRAADARAALGGAGNRPYVAQGDDGQPHLFRDTVDVDTGEVTQRDLGVASEAISKINLENKRAGQAEAAGAAATKNAQTQAQKGMHPTGWRVEKDPEDGLWHNVYYSSNGERIVSPGEAATPTANKPGIAEQVQAEVAARSGAAPAGAPKRKPAPQTNIGVTVPGMGAPSQGNAPVQNPDQETYDSLEDGAPYYWDGVLHYKGK